MTENVIFTHDDRSVRPVLLIKTEGEVYKETAIDKLTLALFDFQKMELAQTKLDKRKLLTSIDLNSAFCPLNASYRSVSKQFKLIPSSEISYQLLPKGLLKLTQRYQVMALSRSYHKFMEI